MIGQNILAVLTLILLILQAADSWTTHHALQRGARELNPFARLAFRFGVAGEIGIAVLKVALTAGVGLVCHSAGIWWPLAVAVPVYAWVVWNNWRNMQP